MKHVHCKSCNRTDVPMNDSLKIDGTVTCGTCIENNFPNDATFEGKKVESEADPTICASCKKDFGSQVLDTISVYPVCEECHTTIKNRTLPLWVKGFFLLVIGLTVFSFFWNWRFYQAYNSIKESELAFSNGDLDKAYELVSYASEKVPELEEMNTMENYFEGLILYRDDKPKEAIIKFNLCVGLLPPEFDLDYLILQSQRSIAYDDKNYSQFLDLSLQSLNYDSTSAMSWASVSSAYSCLYVTEGSDSIKGLTLQYLSKARSIDSTSEAINDYSDMVNYRLLHKEIVTLEELKKKFPNGWDKK